MPIRPHGLAAQAASALCHARTGQRFCAVLRQAPDPGRAAPQQVAQSNSYGNLYGAAPAPAPSGATYYLRRLMA